MATLTYHGHACFSVGGGGYTIWIDPFLTGNPQADLAARDVEEADYILVSHGHGDHLGDAVSIAGRTGATVISNDEIAVYCQAQGVEAHGLQMGGGFSFPFGLVKMTIAFHGSHLPNGSYGGNPGGFLFDVEDHRIYHAGDTGLFYDMKLIGEEQPIDLALLPIGDNYTMGPADALKAVGFLTPKLVIPMHYNTFDVIQQDPYAFVSRVKEIAGVEAAVLLPGESLTL